MSIKSIKIYNHTCTRMHISKQGHATSHPLIWYKMYKYIFNSFIISNKSFNQRWKWQTPQPFIDLNSTWPLLAAQLIHLISNHVIGMASHVCKLWPPRVTLFINPKLIKGNKSTCYFHLLNHGNCWKVWPILRGTFDSNETVKCVAPVWIRHR